MSAQAEREKAGADSARIEAEQQRDRARTALFGTAVAFALAMLAGGYSWWEWAEAQRRTQLALANETRALSALSRAALAQHRPVDSLKLGLASWPRNVNDGRPQLGSNLAGISATLATERIHSRELVHGGLVLGAALTRDERRILSWSFDRTLRLWDAATGQQIGPAMRHDESVIGALLTQDEGRILSWSGDKTLRLWDAATAQQIAAAMRHDEPVIGALLTKDEGRILSWSYDKTLRLWDAATGQQAGPAMRHEKAVMGALLTKDERRILSWSDDKTLRLWDAAWPEGNLIEIACLLIPNRNLDDISQRYDVSISEPICDPKRGPASPDWLKIERAPAKQ